MEAHFEDEVNPTPEELRRWAFSGALEPMQDFDVMIAEFDLLPTLLDLVADPACRGRKTVLNGLYCLFGHEDHDDPRLIGAVAHAVQSENAWLRTWGERASEVLRRPDTFVRSDWCGWDGYQRTPDGG